MALLTFPALRPTDPGFDAACAAFGAAGRPALIAYPADAREVAAVLDHARAAGLRVATHDTAGDVTDAVLLRTSAMTALRVEPGRRCARAGAGVLWQDVVRAAAPHHLAALHGAPDAPAATASLRGGLSWMSRLYGLQSASVTAVDLVLPTGDAVRATAATDPELFWAVRGGGTFGIVTAVEFDLYPVRTVYAGRLVWDRAQAEDVVGTWADWALGAPDAVTTALRLTDEAVIVAGCVLGQEPEAAELIRPLTRIPPTLDTFAQVPAAGLLDLGPAPEDGRLLRAVDPAAFVAGGRGALRQLGGALRRPDPHGGVLGHLPGAFLAGAPRSAAPQDPRLGRLRAALDPDNLLLG